MPARFQWAKCQLDALGRCLSLSDLRNALRTLPKDLDDTYARILESIDNNQHGEHVATIIQWLAYSRRPMSLAEISEVLTVDLKADPQFDEERRLVEPRDILRLCSSLVTLVPKRKLTNYIPPYESPEEWVLQLAHFSVREYLESSRVHDGPAKKFAIQEKSANTLIAESCIIYLFQLFKLTWLEKRSESKVFKEYPLTEYATITWNAHAEQVEEGGSTILLRKAWLLGDGIRLSTAIEHGLLGHTANSQGEHSALRRVINYHRMHIMSIRIFLGVDVNPRNVSLTPLMMISEHHNEHTELVQLLLKDRADVNARAADSTAVMKAACNGRLQSVRILLDHGADAQSYNQQTGDTALTLAIRNGHCGFVEHLLDRGMPTSSPLVVEALHNACLEYDLEILRIFFARGIRVDAELHHPKTLDEALGASILGTALLRTLEYNKFDIAGLVLERAADVIIRSIDKGTPGVDLEHAFNHGSERMIQFLLEYDADLSLVEPEYPIEDEKRRYEELLSKIQSSGLSLLVEEEGTGGSQTDA